MPSRRRGRRAWTRRGSRSQGPVDHAGEEALAARAPGFREDRPALVVAPAAEDLEIARGESLAAKAQAAHQTDRPAVGRLDVRLQSVQPPAPESLGDDE